MCLNPSILDPKIGIKWQWAKGKLWTMD